MQLPKFRTFADKISLPPKLVLGLCIFLLFTEVCPAQTKPQQLKVSSNGHFLEQEDGKPFFYLGDTAWELFHRLNRKEAEKYLENRRQKGFTVIQAVALAELDGINDPNPYGDVPLLDQNPATPALTPGSRPTNDTEYDYWDHVDFIVNTAADKGMYIGFLPTWGEWVIPRFGTKYFNEPEQAYTYGYFLGERYKNHKNIIWILGGDRHPDEQPPSFAIWDAMAEGIADGTTGTKTADGDADYSNTLITYHSFPTSSNWYHDTSWLDFHMWGSYHEKKHNERSYKQAFADFNLPNPKPTINGEPAYEEHPINWEPELGWFSDFDVRQAAYWSVFAGAHGHTYGSHPIWQFYTQAHKPASPTKSEWQEVLDLSGAFQMQYLKNLMLSRPFQERVPDQSLIAGDAGKGAAHVRATRGNSYAFYYLPKGGTVKAQMGKISGKKVKAWWYNPRDGKATEIGTFRNSGSKEFKTPGEAGLGNDWVLVLEDVKQKFSTPGVILNQNYK